MVEQPQGVDHNNQRAPVTGDDSEADPHPEERDEYGNDAKAETLVLLVVRLTRQASPTANGGSSRRSAAISAL